MFVKPYLTNISDNQCATILNILDDNRKGNHIVSTSNLYFLLHNYTRKYHFNLFQLLFSCYVLNFIKYLCIFKIAT